MAEYIDPILAALNPKGPAAHPGQSPTGPAKDPSRYDALTVIVPADARSAAGAVDVDPPTEPSSAERTALILQGLGSAVRAEVASSEPPRVVPSEKAAELTLNELIAALTTPDAIKQQARLETAAYGQAGADSPRGRAAERHVAIMDAVRKADSHVFATSVGTPDADELVTRVSTATSADKREADYGELLKAPAIDAVLVDGEVKLDLTQFVLPHELDDATSANGLRLLRGLPDGVPVIDAATVMVQRDGSVLVVPRGHIDQVAVLVNMLRGVVKVNNLEIRNQDLTELTAVAESEVVPEEAALGPQPDAEPVTGEAAAWSDGPVTSPAARRAARARTNRPTRAGQAPTTWFFVLSQ